MGKQRFKQGLEELGYSVTEKDGQWLTINVFPIEEGRFAGKIIEVGFDVPSDFGLTPPHGPHVKPLLFPVNTKSVDHQVRMHLSDLGADWGQLSRPFPNWKNTNRSVKEYIRYVTHLLNTL